MCGERVRGIHPSHGGEGGQGARLGWAELGDRFGQHFSEVSLFICVQNFCFPVVWAYQRKTDCGHNIVYQILFTGIFVGLIHSSRPSGIDWTNMISNQ